jgi:hypothetical protein
MKCWLRPSLRNGMIKPKNISKRMSKMRRMNPQALILEFKEIIWICLSLPWNEFSKIILI